MSFPHNAGRNPRLMFFILFIARGRIRTSDERCPARSRLSLSSHVSLESRNLLPTRYRTRGDAETARSLFIELFNSSSRRLRLRAGARRVPRVIVCGKINAGLRWMGGAHGRLVRCTSVVVLRRRGLANESPVWTAFSERAEQTETVFVWKDEVLRGDGTGRTTHYKLGILEREGLEFLARCVAQHAVRWFPRCCL